MVADELELVAHPQAGEVEEFEVGGQEDDDSPPNVNHNHNNLGHESEFEDQARRVIPAPAPARVPTLPEEVTDDVELERDNSAALRSPDHIRASPQPHAAPVRSPERLARRSPMGRGRGRSGSKRSEMTATSRDAQDSQRDPPSASPEPHGASFELHDSSFQRNSVSETD